MSSIQGMSAIWDVRYWEISLYNKGRTNLESAITQQNKWPWEDSYRSWRNGNILEQYDRRNNLEITGVLDNVGGYWNTTEDWGKCLNSGYRSLPSSWKFKK